MRSACFAGGGERRWVPAQRGMASIDTLLRASYDLQPHPVATDYLAAATELSLRQRKRSLVMWVTNVRDEDSEDLLGAIRMLQRRHVVVIASLREQALDDVMSSEAEELADAVRAGAAARYLSERAKAHDALRRHGVTVLDVTSAQLPGALVQQYLRSSATVCFKRCFERRRAASHFPMRSASRSRRRDRRRTSTVAAAAMRRMLAFQDGRTGDNDSRRPTARTEYQRACRTACRGWAR